MDQPVSSELRTLQLYEGPLIEGSFLLIAPMNLTVPSVDDVLRLYLYSSCIALLCTS